MAVYLPPCASAEMACFMSATEAKRMAGSMLSDFEISVRISSGIGCPPVVFAA